MKRAIILILLLTTAAYSQQRNLAVDAAIPTPLPAPGPTFSGGSVTLTLAEYNRLMELAVRKPKTGEAAPLPFVLSRAAFKLRVEDQSLLGSVDIDGNVLEKGAIKVPLTTGLTILEARQAGKPLPLLQEGLNPCDGHQWSRALCGVAQPGRGADNRSGARLFHRAGAAGEQFPAYARSARQPRECSHRAGHHHQSKYGKWSHDHRGDFRARQTGASLVDHERDRGACRATRGALSLRHQDRRVGW